jgi:hypothetical protein
MARVVAANLSKALEDPETYQRFVEAGKQRAAYLFTEEARVKQRAGAKAFGKRFTEMKLGWCPEQYRAEYRFLLQRHVKAADAKQIILAKISPFEKQMHALSRGASLIEKPILRKAAPDYTLGGVTDWAA